MRYPIEKYVYHIARKADGTPYQVIAVSTYAGKTVRGVAKCDSRDEFSIEKGKRLAAARCGLKVAEKRAKRAAKKYNEAIESTIQQKRYEERMLNYNIDANNELLMAREELNNILAEM